MNCCNYSTTGDRQRNRVYTDSVWLCIFGVLLICMVITAVFAFVFGNPKRLVHGYDSFGNICGSENFEKIGDLKLSGLDMTNKPYVFFLDAVNIENSLQICVESCPSYQINNLYDLREFYNRTHSSLCSYDFNIMDSNDEDLAHGLNVSLISSSPLGPCPVFPVLKSSPILNRCIPDTAPSLNPFLKRWDLAEQFLADIYESWHLITLLCAFALVASLIMVLMFYLIPNIVGYLILIGVSIVSIGATSTLWWSYFVIENYNSSLFHSLESNIDIGTTFLIYSIIATVVTIIILLLVYISTSRVSFLVTLFKESVECLNALPTLYLQPIVSFVHLMIFYAFWISVIVFLASARYPGAEEVKPVFSTITNATYLSNLDSPGLESLGPIKNISVHTIKTFTRVEFTDGPWVQYMWWLYLICLVWVSEFILACQQMVIAGTVGWWYFNRQNYIEDRELILSPVWLSTKLLLSYHLGSVALGSLLITIFKIPRLILKYFCTSLKKQLCCFGCYEKFICYINHNAYTVVAMQGIDFYPAAIRAWDVLADNTLKIASYNKMGDVVLFLGKILITTLTGFVAVLVFKLQSNIEFFGAPTLIICVFAFFIAHCVISMYEIIIDTLYLCIYEDQDINVEDGPWKSSALVNIDSCTNRQLSENAPINTNR